MLWTLGPNSVLDWPWEPRWAWSPDHDSHWIGDARRVSLVSSRLPRALDTLPELFRLVRSTVEDAARQGERLVVVEGTTLAKIVRQAATIWGAPLLLVCVASPKQLLSDWRSSQLVDEQPLASLDTARLFVSPPFERRPDVPRSQIPVADRLLAALGNRLDVVSLRPGGHWDLLLNEWLAKVSGTLTKNPHRQTIRVANVPKLVPPKLASPLLSGGAALWQPPTNVVAGRPRSLDTDASHQQPAATSIAWDDPHSPRDGPGTYLVHATRRCDGPWPGQNEGDYLDELLWERPERDRSPLATLVRILQQGRMEASSRAIRGGAAVVCFAEIDLDHLAERRIWRRHRRRWDFEPFGIAVDRDWLMRRGARPVIYGDESVWHALADDDRPYFQRNTPVSTESPSASEPAIDWRVECEWRVMGSIDLAALSDEQALVFVPDRESARRAAPHCRFPIRVISDSLSDVGKSSCRF